MSFLFPAAFEDRMKLSLGANWKKFLSAHLTDSPVSIRINPLKNNLSRPANVPWSSFGMYLDERPVFTLDPSFHAGAYYVQEASSMFLEQMIQQSVDLTKPLRVLDLCAAPGGKSTHLLSLLSRDSLLVANEVIGSRTHVLSENLQKWGNANVVVTQNDPADFQKLPGYFDVIVIDAPCSGEGLFRKDHGAMKEWSREDVEHCSHRQRRILHDSWPALKKNGILIYCTCTYSEQENEDNLTWLHHMGMESVEIKIDPSWGIDVAHKGNGIGYRFYPHRVKGEGFFISAYRKTKEEIPVRTKSKSSFAKPPKRITDQMEEWIGDNSSFQLTLQDDLIVMIPAAYSREIEFMTGELRVITKGVALASIKHEKLVPAHAAALSNELKKENFNVLELDQHQALAYLRKDILRVEDSRKGFALVTCKKLSLGWVNLLGNRINNLYPSGWRIRMGS